jgi:hypothetical protein
MPTLSYIWVLRNTPTLYRRYLHSNTITRFAPLPILESEVFFKAKHLAQNETDEQKNQVQKSVISPQVFFLDY